MNSSFSKFKVMALALLLSVVASPAMAAATFDTAPIIADIGVYSAAAVLLISAMIAARWGRHLFSLVKPKG